MRKGSRGSEWAWERTGRSSEKQMRVEQMEDSKFRGGKIFFFHYHISICVYVYICVHESACIKRLHYVLYIYVYVYIRIYVVCTCNIYYVRTRNFSKKKTKKGCFVHNESLRSFNEKCCVRKQVQGRKNSHDSYDALML